jgi:hypothetical protein
MAYNETLAARVRAALGEFDSHLVDAIIANASQCQKEDEPWVT